MDIQSTNNATVSSDTAAYDSPPTVSSRHLDARRSRRSIPFKRIAAGLVVLVLLAGGWEGYTALHAVTKVFHGSIFSTAKALVAGSPLTGETNGRVNVLLAGDSADDNGHGGADLTDSIMVLSIDTKQHTAFMMSIPRDLWVNIPGWSHQKINAANDVSKFNEAGYPKGGMGMLQKLVQEDLGIPINYYALINYTAFRDSVDAVGGVTVNIQSPDPRGLYDPNLSKADGGPLLLGNGLQTLNGRQALNLARARGDPCYCGHIEYGFPQSDYNRTQHQRMMLIALQQKALSAGVVGNPVSVVKLFNSLGNNVNTNMTADNAIRFVQITKDINLANVQSLTYPNGGPNGLLRDYRAADGEEALIPKDGIDEFGGLQQYYQQLVSNNPVIKEAPTAVIINATNTMGLARKEAATLKKQGFNVLNVSSANATYSGTMIVDNTATKKPASKLALQQQIKAATAGVNGATSGEAYEAHGYTADFVIILGSNWDQLP